MPERQRPHVFHVEKSLTFNCASSSLPTPTFQFPLSEQSLPLVPQRDHQAHPSPLFPNSPLSSCPDFLFLVLTALTQLRPCPFPSGLLI
jgi:hypothetical protein